MYRTYWDRKTPHIKSIIYGVFLSQLDTVNLYNVITIIVYHRGLDNFVNFTRKWLKESFPHILKLLVKLAELQLMVSDTHTSSAIPCAVAIQNTVNHHNNFSNLETTPLFLRPSATWNTARASCCVWLNL